MPGVLKVSIRTLIRQKEVPAVDGQMEDQMVRALGRWATHAVCGHDDDAAGV